MHQHGYRVKIFKRQNDGFGAGHNYALQKGDAPFCLISNIDLCYMPDTLSKLVATAIADSTKVAAWETRQKPYEHPKYYDPVTGITPWNSHACILIRREAIRHIGGYDEAIFMYGEDVEMSYHLRQAGYLLRYCPAAVVEHYTYEDTQQIKPIQYTSSIFANFYIRLKYGKLANILLVPYLATIQIARQEIYPGARRELFQQYKSLLRIAPKTLIKRKRSVHQFPFNRFDYTITRQGAFYRAPENCPHTPLVSIITRTIGSSASMLRQTILSVAQQTYPCVEHIIIQNGGESMKAVVSEMSALTKTNIRYFQENEGGRSRAGNVGLTVSNGKWCLFLDDDDLIFADHVEVLVDALQRHPEYVAAYSLAWEVMTEQQDKYCRYRGIDRRIPALHQQAFCSGKLKLYDYIPIQAILFERQLFLERGGFDEDMDALEDWLLWNRYAQGNQFIFVEKLTSLYRVPASPAKIRDRENSFQRAYPAALKKIATAHHG